MKMLTTTWVPVRVIGSRLVSAVKALVGAVI
jgi:hypothetical protein